MATKHLATVEELEQLDDDFHRYDLVRGELIKMPPAGGPHGELAAGIVARLWLHVRSNNLGRVYTSETGFHLQQNPDVVLAPDAAFIQTDHLPAESERHGFYKVAPDLVVEVLSPSETLREVERKTSEYLLAGVRLVWLVDPVRRSIVIRRSDSPPTILNEADTLDAGDALPGFSVLVAEIFE